MKSNVEGGEMDKTKKKKKRKSRRSRTNKAIEDFQQENIYQSKDIIKNFEKLLITEQEFNKSQKNFICPNEIKTGNR